jgi:hypothetical protein
MSGEVVGSTWWRFGWIRMVLKVSGVTVSLAVKISRTRKGQIAAGEASLSPDVRRHWPIDDVLTVESVDKSYFQAIGLSRDHV